MEIFVWFCRWHFDCRKSENRKKKYFKNCSDGRQYETNQKVTFLNISDWLSTGIYRENVEWKKSGFNRKILWTNKENGHQGKSRELLSCQQKQKNSMIYNRNVYTEKISSISFQFFGFTQRIIGNSSWFVLSCLYSQQDCIKIINHDTRQLKIRILRLQFISLLLLGATE